MFGTESLKLAAQCSESKLFSPKTLALAFFVIRNYVYVAHVSRMNFIHCFIIVVEIA
jgi:hypothetical protein